MKECAMQRKGLEKKIKSTKKMANTKTSQIHKTDQTDNI